MKKLIFRFLGLLTMCVTLAVCENGPCISRYFLEIPAVPPAWEAMLGSPRWKIEWYNPDGRRETRSVGTGERLSIELPHTQANAVLAWPYWSGHGIEPGTFMPAGGLFPFDARGDTLLLTWKGGVDAVLYRELARAAVEAGGKSSVPRLPANFNWPRFRELYTDATVNAEFRADPWLADWPSIAQKIRQSGFDKRRLVPQAREKITVPDVPHGPWIGTSPFADPLYFDAEPVFSVRVGGSPDTWVCSSGLLRCTPRTWLFLEW